MNDQAIKIALAGNPNSGKTTLFNRLTGSNQHIGNWPGVTIEKKEGHVKGRTDIIIQDLPGIYSLSPYTLEEEISRNYLTHETPDVILNIVDSSNIERNLYLTTQLLELDVPVVVALNMIDVARRDGDQINAKALADRLGCAVVETSALKGEGVEEVIEASVAAAQAHDARLDAQQGHVRFNETVERALQQIAEIIGEQAGRRDRWYAVKAFERDDKALESLKLTDEDWHAIETIIDATEEALDDDAEGIITGERYVYIKDVMKKTVHKAERRDNLSRSDRIDRVLTHRFWAYPIFILIITGVYYVAITLGLETQDLVADAFFAEIVQANAETWLIGLGAADWLVSLIVDGIIAGVGAVLSFVPQMLILFLLLGIMEDVGYMARIAFILDRLFRRFGLSGKSFIPMLIGSGCSVPGIMASRTIENERDRRMTIINTPMIPCGAKLPIIALVAGAVFGGAWWVAPLAYVLGLVAVIISGIILKKTKLFAGDPAPFVMELPAYHAPSASNVLRSTWERGWSFIKRAGTIILLSSIIIWFFASFGVVDGTFGMVDDIHQSMAATIGNALAWIFAPLGFGNWQATIASIMGLIAKEEIISVFGVLYGLEEAVDLVEAGAFDQLLPIASHFTRLTAFSFMIFNLFCPPCFASIGAVRREMNSAKWTWFTVGYLFVFAYVFSFLVYQLGLLFTGHGFNVATAIAFVLLAGVLYLLFRKPRHEEPKQLAHH